MNYTVCMCPTFSFEVILSLHTKKQIHKLQKKQTYFPLQNNHATEEELGIPWTVVLVGVPLMALKMCSELGMTLAFSSTGVILKWKTCIYQNVSKCIIYVFIFIFQNGTGMSNTANLLMCCSLTQPPSTFSTAQNFLEMVSLFSHLLDWGEVTSPISVLLTHCPLQRVLGQFLSVLLLTFKRSFIVTTS